MGPKRKQSKPNAFLLFMQDMKPQVEKRVGRSVTMMEMPNLVSADWARMPQCEKDKYKKGIDAAKGGKMDSKGRLISEIEEEERDIKRRNDQMQQYISNTVEELAAGNAISSHLFYVMSMSYYVRVDEGKYVPAELSVCKFSFQRGIIAVFHQIIAANIPAGFKFEAKQHSENTHNIPLNHPEAESDLERVRQDLFTFIMQDEDELAVVYTMDDKRYAAQDMLNTCFGKDLLRIYSLELLLQHVYIKVLSNCTPIPKSIAKDMLNSCKLDYRLTLGCKWHRGNAPDSVVHCTLSMCQRWLFLMCDELRIRESMGVTLKHGKHIPNKDDFEGFETEEYEERAPPKANPWSSTVQKRNEAPSINSDAFPSLSMGGMGRGFRRPDGLSKSFGGMKLEGSMSGIGRGAVPKRNL